MSNPHSIQAVSTGTSHRITAAGRFPAHLLLPVLLFVGICGISVWVWHAHRAAENADVIEDAKLVTVGMANRLQVMLQDEVRPLRRLARDLGNGTLHNARNFTDAALSVQQLVPAMRVIAWVDVSGTVQAVSAIPPGDGPATGTSIVSLPGWGDAFANVIKPPRIIVSSAPDESHDVQWICVDIVAPEQTTERHRGAVIAKAALAARAADLLDQRTRNWFEIAVRDPSGRMIYGSARVRASSQFEASEPLRVFDSEWKLSVRPTQAFIASRHGSRPRFILIGGIGLAALVSLGTAQVLLHRRRDRVRTTTHLAALEALARISEGITDKPGESEHLLAQLAELAATLTDMPMRIVAMRDPDGASLRIIHRQGTPPQLTRDVYSTDETPLSLQAMSSKSMLMVGDVERNPPASIQLLRAHQIRCFIMMPLLVSGEATGVILLACPQPRKFTALDRRLSELWMAQASALLSNRKLYQRMDAALLSRQHMIDQRDTLYQVNMTIQRAGSLREALDRVAELAPRALEVDACVVVLAHANPQCIQIAAVTPIDPPHTLPVDAVVECATCASVIRAGQNKIVPDTDVHPIRGFPDMGSALFVPLRGGAATNGLLVLLRRQRGEFDPKLVQTAELFAASAAAAIERARLYEQTRRHAETNATLLRELNHRVGNNLGSIVGLLSMAARQLPEQSRQWVDRAIERVHMMARAHQLFSGGVESVALGELLRMTLSFVAPAQNSDLQISISVESEELKLPSSQAVTLAMVVHELAYNAVVHGLCDGGELLVRGRRIGADRIAIDVIDRAQVPVATSATVERRAQLGIDSGNGNGNGGHKHGGIGLQLVRNLVMRELQGTFSLSRASGGATVACVEFPIREHDREMT